MNASIDEELHTVYTGADLDRALYSIRGMSEDLLENLLEWAYINRGKSLEKDQRCADAFWMRIISNCDSFSLSLRLIKVFAALTAKTTSETVDYFYRALNRFLSDPERFLWKNQILSCCLHLAQNPGGRTLMQKPQFFMRIYDHIIFCPYKATVLLIFLINEDLYKVIQKILVEGYLFDAKGSLRTVLEILLAYIEGYTLQAQEKEPEEPAYGKKLALPWDKRRLGYYPLESHTLKVLLDALLQKRSFTLVYEAIAFLIESSPSVSLYIMESGDLHKIIKEALSSTGLQKLKTEHFLIRILEKNNSRIIKILSEEGYIEHLLKRVEARLDVEVFDGEMYSCMALLRLLSRNKQIVTHYLSTYQMINLMEKFATIAHKVYKRDKYQEITENIEQFLMLLSNLVLLNTRWKETATESILPHIEHYLEKQFRMKTLQFIRMLLYECKETEIQEKLYRTLQIYFFKELKWSQEEILESYKIYRNLVCIIDISQPKESIILWLINEFFRVSKILIEKNKTKPLTEIEIQISMELLSIVSNIAAISQESVISPELIKFAILLSNMSSSLSIGFIWFITNATWNSIQAFDILFSFDIHNVLLSKKGNDPDINERISQLISHLSRRPAKQITE
ncbi:hypothetical protein NEFER03_0270 [Nematocida sp. LUAm3]|nr:hypothetical protein NEFER03_0270 [Nematocida sp. LUAm3]KAI5173723.1 hypothetical protein NEFER02_0239 [Nematocida sp. LUAm2]KAI5176945.1 hypothetical protein NEFER01_0270 [Nematocida sp. LUAm1]